MRGQHDDGTGTPTPPTLRQRHRIAHTARLAAARERLDAEIVERRRREDGLLTEYAAATDAVTEAEARRDAALAELERRAAEVRATAEQELATLEARQGAVLAALHGDRTAEELAHLVALPLRRVRTLLRSHREPEGATEASPATAAPATPASAPPAQLGAATGDSRSGGDGPAGPETTAGPDAEPDAGPPPGDRPAGDTGGAHWRGTRCGAHRRGTGPPRPSRADRGRLASGSAGAPAPAIVEAAAATPSAGAPSPAAMPPGVLSAVVGGRPRVVVRFGPRLGVDGAEQGDEAGDLVAAEPLVDLYDGAFPRPWERAGEDRVARSDPGPRAADSPLPVAAGSRVGGQIDLRYRDGEHLRAHSDVPGHGQVCVDVQHEVPFERCAVHRPVPGEQIAPGAPGGGGCAAGGTARGRLHRVPI